MIRIRACYSNHFWLPSLRNHRYSLSVRPSVRRRANIYFDWRFAWRTRFRPAGWLRRQAATFQHPLLQPGIKKLLRWTTTRFQPPWIIQSGLRVTPDPTRPARDLKSNQECCLGPSRPPLPSRPLDAFMEGRCTNVRMRKKCTPDPARSPAGIIHAPTKCHRAREERRGEVGAGLQQLKFGGRRVRRNERYSLSSLRRTLQYRFAGLESRKKRPPDV